MRLFRHEGPRAAMHAMANNVVSINLLEPFIRLNGWDGGVNSDGSSAVIRGTVVLQLAEPAEIEMISLHLTGTLSTSHYDRYIPRLRRRKILSIVDNHLSLLQVAPGKKHKPVLPCSTAGVLYPKGHHRHNFELLMESDLPESVEADPVSVRYRLEASVKLSSRFRRMLRCSRPIAIVRLPSTDFLGTSEGLNLSHCENGRLWLDIQLERAASALGSDVHLSLHVAPLVKLACRWLEVYMIEDVYLNIPDGGLSGFSGRKVLLLERCLNCDTVALTPRRADHACCPLEYTTDEVLTAAKVPLLAGGWLGGGNISRRLSFDVRGSDKLTICHRVQVVLEMSVFSESDGSYPQNLCITLEGTFYVMHPLATAANIYVPLYSSAT